ncbi:MAG TPA: hypothetical protein VMV10_31165, partial [Pirellulales bacterium]|nr:hypothetical protein [Pirellulales bacterium]
IRPASSAGNKHIPCALTVTASLLPWWVLFQTPRYSRTVTCAYFNGIGAKPAPIGHEMPCFGASAEGPARRETLVFSKNFAPRRRFASVPRAAI